MSVNDSVLIIDFDPRSLKASRKLLESKGIPCICVSSATELDERLQGEQPALVVLDPMLPGRDGFRVCRTLKAGGSGTAAPVIIASRIFKGQRYRNLAREAGADLYLERPRDDARLLAEITRLLGESASRRAPAARRAASPSTTSAPVATFSSQPAGPLLEGLTDDEIDSALFRALGDDAGLTGAGVTGGGATGPAIPESLVAGSSGTLDAQTRAAPLMEPDAGAFALMADPPASGNQPNIPAAAPQSAPDPHVASVPADAGVSAAPEPTATAVAVSPPAEEPAVPAPARMEVMPHAEDLWASLEKLQLQVAQELGPTRTRSASSGLMTGTPPPPTERQTAESAGPAARTLDSPMAYDPSQEQMASVEAAPSSAALSPAAPSTSPGTSQELPAAPAGTGSHRIPLADTPSPDAPSGPIADTGTIESVVDNVIAFVTPANRQTGQERAESEQDAASSLPSQEFLVAGESGAADKEEELPLEDSQEEVPESLRGMDAGTADLLSSLEELESSLPDDFGETAGTAPTDWNQTGLTGQGDPQLEPSIPHTPPPISEEEASLEGLVEHLVSQVPQPVAVGASSNPPGDSHEIEARSPSGISLEEPPSRRFAGTLLAALAVAIVLLGAAGGFYLTRMRPVETPPSVAREMPAPPALRTAPPSPEMQAASTALADLSRRQLPDQLPPDDQPAGPDTSAGGEQPAPAQAVASKQTRPVEANPARTIQPAPTQQTKPATASASPPGRPEGSAPESGGGGGPTAAATTSPRPEAPGPPKSRPVPAAAKGSIDKQPQSTSDDPRHDGRPQPATLLDAPPEPPSAPNPLEPPAPLVRLGELDYPLRLLEAPQPEMTPQALEKGVKGRVFVNVLVGPNGEVKDARVMIEPGYGLGRAALRAVKNWRFSPPRHRAQRVRVWKTEVVEFRSP